MEIAGNERKGPSNTANITDETTEDLPSKIAQYSCPEKVIICIDRNLLHRTTNNPLISLIRHYRKVKETISVQPVEFHHMFFNKREKDKEIKPKIEQFDTEKYDGIFRGYAEELDETRSCDLGLIFQTLAETFKLPDPNYFNDARPPPYVIHVILIFGRNLFTPKLSDPNRVLFFAKNPFFTLDILHLHDGNPDNRHGKIAEMLKILSKTCSGYFHSFDRTKTNEIQSVFNEFLGHPLIRYPQDTAIFKIDIREQESV